MNAAKIIVREVQSASGLQVRQLLRKSVRQARESAHLRPSLDSYLKTPQTGHIEAIRRHETNAKALKTHVGTLREHKSVAFHDQLPAAIQDGDHNRFLVHVHSDIFDGRDSFELPPWGKGHSC